MQKADMSAVAKIKMRKSLDCLCRRKESLLGDKQNAVRESRVWSLQEKHGEYFYPDGRH